MRRFITISFITLALFIGAASAAPAAHAQNTENEDAYAQNTSTTAQEETSVAAQPDGANNSVTFDAQKQDTAYNGIMIMIMKLFAWLVGVAALTLDYTVFYTVVTMGDYIHDLSAVGIAWRILRDLSNIILIFGFLAIGISIILDVDVYGWGKGLLPKLLIVAVLLNFSLFITEAVIDTGNLFATQFYTQINGGTLPTSESLSKTKVSSEGISNKIMSQLGLQTIYGGGTLNTEIFKAGNTWIIGFMGIILFLITAFVMFSLAFILIARFVILIFIIILAPIGFAGLAVPKLSSYANQWWDELFKQTITAPVLLLLLYVALIVITDVGFLTGFDAGGPSGPSWLGFLDNGNLTGFAGMILSFLVAMGLLLAVVIFSKKLSGTTAGWATKVAGTIVGGYIGRGVIGGASLIGRGTFGLTGRALNSKYMQARAARGGAGSKLLVTSGKFLANRTYDVRNLAKVPGIGRVAGIATGALGGALAMGGAGEIAKGIGGGATVTAQKAVDKTIETYKNVKPFSGEWWRSQQKEYEAVASERDRKSKLAAAALPTIPPNTASVDTQKELKKMSVDELAQLKDIRNGISTLVYNLSPEKFSELMKSDKLLAGEKKKLKDTWENQFTVANAATTIRRFDTEEIVALGGGTLTQNPVIDTLGANEFDAIRRKGNLNQQQRHDIYAHMTNAPAGSALATVYTDYFSAAGDPRGDRMKYWNV